MNTTQNQRGNSELNSELKPCPFCGGYDVTVQPCFSRHVLKKYHGQYFAGCRDCGITTGLYRWQKTRSPLLNENNKKIARQTAIEAWNRRAEK